MILLIMLIRQIQGIGIRKMIRTDTLIPPNIWVESLAVARQNRELLPVAEFTHRFLLSPTANTQENFVFGFIRSLLSGRNRSTQILRTFEGQKQQLQEDFFRAASQTGKPRGLRWKNCDWLSTYSLVQDPETQMFTLFYGVNISFEAIEGGDMEGVEAVSMIRDGSAVFHAQDGHWGTGGKVLFNMDPATASTCAAPGQPVLATSVE